jgi:hypothetical protein
VPDAVAVAVAVPVVVLVVPLVVPGVEDDIAPVELVPLELLAAAIVT